MSEFRVPDWNIGSIHSSAIGQDVSIRTFGAEFTIPAGKVFAGQVGYLDVGAV